jgi:hypothetical protein
MDQRSHSVRPTAATVSEARVTRDDDRREGARFAAPTIEEVSLSCEISAYAPDGDDFPLF